MMRRINLIVALVLLTTISNAQVNIFNGNLEQCKAEAKKQNKKLIMTMTSSNCEFYKKLVEEEFSKPDVAESINRDYVVGQLFIDDDVTLRKQLELVVAPTTVIYDENGVELTRDPGAIKENFVEEINKMLDSQNILGFHEAKVKEDITYAVEYSRILDSRFMRKTTADEVLLNYLSTLTPAELASEYIRDICAKNIRHINSPIFVFLLENSDKVVEFDNNNQFQIFIKVLSANLMKYTLFNSQFSQDDFDFGVNLQKKYPLINTAYTNFIVEVKDAIFERKDLNEIILSAEKYVRESDLTKDMVLRTCIDIIRVESDKTPYNDNMANLFKVAQKSEKNKEKKKSYGVMVKRFKAL